MPNGSFGGGMSGVLYFFPCVCSFLRYSIYSLLLFGVWNTYWAMSLIPSHILGGHGAINHNRTDAR